jgi:sigma-B regulation protein RsbU (phosphoserine phosphatase)
MKTAQQLEKEIQRLKTAVEELTVLNDLAVAASSSLEVDEMLDTILKKSIKALNAEQGSISLVTEQRDKPFKTLIRYGNRTNHLPSYRVGDHITGWVLKQQRPLIIEKLAQDKRFQPSEQERKEIRSVLCVPIWCKAKIIGIIMLTNKKTGEPFNSDDLRLLSIIAPQSGQLIQNSRLQEEAIEKKRMEQELVLARRIQMGLLPNLEQLTSDLDISSYFNPAEEVGGDYYDYFPLGEGQIGIVIADVSGHGASAAMMMTMVKGVLHSITHEFSSADQALNDINSILTRIVPKEIFITMMFLVFDISKKVLRFSNAGHIPLLYYNSQSNSCQLVECRGCALNLTTEATFLVKEMAFKRDDLFFIYTDGVTEAVNETMEMFEETRLIREVEEIAKESAAGVIDHLKAKLNDFTGRRPQEDDILMLALKIK